MNTANKLTLLRIIMIPIFLWLILEEGAAYHMWALGVFVVAAATDGIDGYVARKYNQITTFGKFIDPLADKMLTTAAFLALMHYGMMNVWALMAVLAREFIVMGIRLVAVGDGRVIAASFWGKLKTVSQIVAVCVAMLLMNVTFGIPQEIADLIINVLIWISVALTIISGADYLIKNWDVMEMENS